LDHVDQILAQWARERPDLDVAPVAVFARITRASRGLERAMSVALREFGLSRGEFDVIVSLRRAGVPHRLNPSDLAQSLLLSTGTMTNRVDRLERAGWVTRLPDPEDRRGILVQLTESGLVTVEAAMEALLRTERGLLDGFGVEDQRALANLLRRVVLVLDARAPGPRARPDGEGGPDQVAATGSP
jgi:DNA-binding MarR family transcriptional regulator